MVVEAGHEIIAELPIEEVRDQFGAKRAILNGVIVRMDTKTLRLFHRNGCKCARCGLEANTVRLERDLNQKYPHVKVYYKNPTGKYWLMTKDHIRPKAKGGQCNPQNLQPLCIVCNHRKGAKFVNQKGWK
jgi:5-methylcytosine-specific restriction endonuclease McrA